MEQRASIEEFAPTLLNELKTYTDDVCEKITKGEKRIASRALRMVRERSPKRTGTYSKAWGKDFISNHKGAWTVIKQKGGSYRLTQLLEGGHYNVLTGKDVKGHPFIDDINNECVIEMEKIITKAVE